MWNNIIKYNYIDFFGISLMIHTLINKHNFRFSLIKMVYTFAKSTGKKPTWQMIKHCIKRNFGGFKHSKDQDPLAVFSKILRIVEKPSTIQTVCFDPKPHIFKLNQFLLKLFRSRFGLYGIK